MSSSVPFLVLFLQWTDLYSPNRIHIDGSPRNVRFPISFRRRRYLPHRTTYWRRASDRRHSASCTPFLIVTSWSGGVLASVEVAV
jgi:hypothetical protein